MELLDDEAIRADVCVTDPPYGQTSLAWDRWVEGWPTRIIDHLPATTSLWCFGSMRMFFDHLAEFRGWSFAQEIVWEKQNGSTFHADRFRRVHEFTTHWYRGRWHDLHREPQHTNDAVQRAVRRKWRPAHTGNIDAGAYVSDDGGPRLMRSVLSVPSTHGRALHPTQKPLELLEPLIRYSCPPGGTVLDPFAGTGSTLLAARLNGRHAIGIEADERYCELAVRRLSQGPLDLADADTQQMH